MTRAPEVEADVWVTGACGEECEEYAGEKQWKVRLKGGEHATAWPQ